MCQAILAAMVPSYHEITGSVAVFQARQWPGPN